MEVKYVPTKVRKYCDNVVAHESEYVNNTDEFYKKNRCFMKL